MVKRITSIAIVLLLTVSPALAEVFAGTTVAYNTIAITSKAAGMIDKLYVQTGSAIKEGEIIASLRTTKVFATQNGTVARIHAKEDKENDGTVLEIAPVSRYTVYCTSDEAYDSFSSNLVHCGETLYMKCTTNGTHQGQGRIYSIDNETYMVESTAGEFYVGETVYLYRDPEYAYKKLVGIGTVVSSATEAYKSEGKITTIHVSEGEYVEKGELLYEVIEGESIEIVAPADGIITSCEVANGSSVTDNQIVANLVANTDICIAVQLSDDQLSQVSIGDYAALSCANHVEEKQISGKVIEISELAQNGFYMVYIVHNLQEII